MSLGLGRAIVGSLGFEKLRGEAIFGSSERSSTAV